MYEYSRRSVGKKKFENSGFLMVVYPIAWDGCALAGRRLDSGSLMLDFAYLPLVVIDNRRSWCRVAEIQEWMNECGGHINAGLLEQDPMDRVQKWLLSAACDEAEDCKTQHVDLHVVQQVSTEVSCGYKAIWKSYT